MVLCSRPAPWQRPCTAPPMVTSTRIVSTGMAHLFSNCHTRNCSLTTAAPTLQILFPFGSLSFASSMLLSSVALLWCAYVIVSGTSSGLVWTSEVESQPDVLSTSGRNKDRRIPPSSLKVWLKSVYIARFGMFETNRTP
jgi:hypothetical protein